MRFRVAVYLLNANILIALAWPDHFAHGRAIRWFAQMPERGWVLSDNPSGVVESKRQANHILGRGEFVC
jgi:hypothetical protein